LVSTFGASDFGASDFGASAAPGGGVDDSSRRAGSGTSTDAERTAASGHLSRRRKPPPAASGATIAVEVRSELKDRWSDMTRSETTALGRAQGISKVTERDRHHVVARGRPIALAVERISRK